MGLYRYQAFHQGALVATRYDEAPCLWHAHLGKRNFIDTIIEDFRKMDELYEPDDFEVTVSLVTDSEDNE